MPTSLSSLQIRILREARGDISDRLPQDFLYLQDRQLLLDLNLLEKAGGRFLLASRGIEYLARLEKEEFDQAWPGAKSQPPTDKNTPSFKIWGDA